MDVLVGEKDKNELYRGTIEKIIYDKQNKIEHILLKKTLLFKRLEFDKPWGYEEFPENNSISVKGKEIKENTIHILSTNYLIYKKVIEGDIFVIPATNIKNINFSYVPPFKKEEVINVSETSEIEQNINPNLIGGLFVVGILSVLSFIWSYFQISDFINYSNTIVSIILQFLKGLYLIVYVISVIGFLFSILRKGTSLNEKINSVHVILFFTILLYGVLYNIPVVFTLTLSFSYNLIVDFLRWLFKKIDIDGTLSNLIILIVCFIYSILVFIYCFKI